ncbi:non-canonical purine NTP pyrophosphatase [Leuconostocaceae bacterium ESL0958]|nr:non-canonical purine NTP pyrophosphatase [Leuconostocaceae bacterium ESL0958]
MRFVLASNNRAKTKELAILAKQMGQEVVNYRDLLQQKLTFPAESEDNQEVNALAKARFIHQYLPEEAVLGDDTGLYLAAFPDRFGVTSSREFHALGLHGTAAEIDYLLNLYQPGMDRSAYLLASFALVLPNGQELTTQARGGVRLATAARPGPYLQGLDDILEAENGLTLSEMPLATVLAYHDRSRALAALVDQLKD